MSTPFLKIFLIFLFVLIVCTIILFPASPTGGTSYKKPCDAGDNFIGL